ncbi:hypothetical protein, partial [Paenibacillus xylaniclasticus]|uniref:hypothetical protein n=1 Tax=Paenibacillus xylaniclasticus TaxID=588083 RepID=UPI001C3F541A
GKRFELITEKGAYTMQANKSSDSFVIEIVDDNEDVEIEDAGSTEELKVWTSVKIVDTDFFLPGLTGVHTFELRRGTIPY